MGANKSGPDPISFILNWQILLGIACYGIGAVLMIISLRGGEVTVLYPIITSSYIWVTISSSYFFGEAINPLRGFGIFLIIAGILMITFGEKDKKIIGYMEPV
jgi:drug/metabolite transporter (DMT)-like permease